MCFGILHNSVMNNQKIPCTSDVLVKVDKKLMQGNRSKSKIYYSQIRVQKLCESRVLSNYLELIFGFQNEHLKRGCQVVFLI